MKPCHDSTANIYFHWRGIVIAIIIIFYYMHFEIVVSQWTRLLPRPICNLCEIQGWPTEKLRLRGSSPKREQLLQKIMQKRRRVRKMLIQIPCAGTPKVN